MFRESIALFILAFILFLMGSTGIWDVSSEFAKIFSVIFLMLGIITFVATLLDNGSTETKFTKFQ